MLFFFTKP